MYLTCSNINLCNHCLLDISVTSHSCPWLQPPNSMCQDSSFAFDYMLIFLGSLNLRLNSKHQIPSYHESYQTLDFDSQPTWNTWTLILGQCSAWAEAKVQNPLNPSPKQSVVQCTHCDCRPSADWCGVTSGILGCFQVLLDCRGDRQSVVHLLIGWCAKGGPRHWLQLVCCAYLWSGVQVFWVSRAEVWGLCQRTFNKGVGICVR